MDENTLAAIERLRALGALDVRIGDVRVRFEPALPAATVPTFEVDPEAAQAELEALLYHSSS